MIQAAPVEIALRSGKHTVRGEVYGIWAVTPAAYQEREGAELTLVRAAWRVTHVPTGYGVTADKFFSKAAARRIAKRYHAELDQEFWATHKAGNPIPSEQDKLAQRIRNEEGD